MADLPAGVAIKTVTAFMIVHRYRLFHPFPPVSIDATIVYLCYSATRIWQLQNRLLLADKRSRG